MTCSYKVSTDGGFKRTAAGFSGVVEAGSRFEPQAGRYHLYVSLACPWAAGTLTALHLKGLEDTISVSIVHPTWRKTRPDDPKDEHVGWHFRSPGDAPVPNENGYGANECDDALVPDTVNGCATIRELYEMAKDETGKYSTPVLWCKQEKTIVCNESLGILKIFDKSFTSLCKHPEVSLFPAEFQAETEALNEWVYPTVNNGVYRCGFARSQGAYEMALAELFGSLDRLEAHLQGQMAKGEGFLTAHGAPTWLDIRLYHTLVRFDPVYVTYFKTNLKRIEDYPQLLAFTRRVYGIPAVKATTNLRHIKMHYFTSHPTLNIYGIIPGYNGAALE